LISKLAKEEGFRLDGTVTEVLPNAMFRVQQQGTSKLNTGVI
jgi:translation initiation factor IF-1